MAISKAVEEQLIPVPEAASLEPEFEYVDIPERDLFGFKFHGVGINLDHYAPGQHKVSPERAAEIRQRLAMAEHADLKTISPRQDSEALKVLLGLARSKGVQLTTGR